MLLILFAILLCAVYYYYKIKKTFNYWKDRGVKYVEPIPIIGNMLPTLLQTKTTASFIQDLYQAFPNERYVGIYQFGTPILLLRDPELIKSITIKNFEHFVDHKGFLTPEADPLWGKNLFSSEGDRWRDLRQTLSPVFTSSKMRSMFVFMDECTRQVIEYFHNQNKDTIEIEMKDISTRYMNDVIATTAFGIKVDSLKEKDNEFMKSGRELTDMSGWNRLKFLVYGNYPTLAKMLNLKIVSKRVGDFFTSIICETIKFREEKNIIRPDMIHLLMLARQNKLKYEELLDLPDTGFATAFESEVGKTASKSNGQFLTDEDITAQALVFFFGGFDTSSSLLSFAAYELAVNPNIQSKLRAEINSIDELTYETLLGMKYMDMVVSETLRKWTQALWIDRKCTKAFVIEPERPGESRLELKPGDICWWPIWALHRDEKYHPNPDVFDPERFSDENKDKIQPGTFTPFGGGPRNCIGSRFALLENKIFFFHLLKNFEIVPVVKTQIPINICKNNFTLTSKDGFHLGLKRLC